MPKTGLTLRPQAAIYFRPWSYGAQEGICPSRTLNFEIIKQSLIERPWTLMSWFWNSCSSNCFQLVILLCWYIFHRLLNWGDMGCVESYKRFQKKFGLAWNLNMIDYPRHLLKWACANDACFCDEQLYQTNFNMHAFINNKSNYFE